MKPTWETSDGAVKLYLGDSREVLPTLPPCDACVTDPPYGICEAAGKNKSRTNLAIAKDYGNLAWDDSPPSAETIDTCRKAAKWQVIFGGNYFQLPPSSCWLVWDKLNSGDFADCELAWTNLPKAVRRLAFRWNGMIRDEACERIHPTQKPVRVMEWAMSHCPQSKAILDPFAGSMTTVIACIRTWRKCIAIEREPSYFWDGVKRIEAELNRMPLFEPPAKIQREILTA